MLKLEFWVSTQVRFYGWIIIVHAVFFVISTNVFMILLMPRDSRLPFSLVWVFTVQTIMHLHTVNVVPVVSKLLECMNQVLSQQRSAVIYGFYFIIYLVCSTQKASSPSTIFDKPCCRCVFSSPPSTPYQCHRVESNIVKREAWKVLVCASKVSEIPVHQFTADLCFRNMNKILIRGLAFIHHDGDCDLLLA